MSTRLPIMTPMTILLALALAGTMVPTPVAANSDFDEATRTLARIDQSGKPPDANTIRLVEQAANELHRALDSKTGLSENAEYRRHARRGLELARQAEAAHGRGAVGGSGFTPSVPGFGGGGTTRQEAIVRGGTALIQGIQGMVSQYAAAAERERAEAAARERAREAALQKRVASVEEMIRTGRMRAAQARVKKQAEQEQGKKTLRLAMLDEAKQANSAEQEEGKKTLRLAMLDEAKQASSVIEQMQEEIEADRTAIHAAVDEAIIAVNAAVDIANSHPSHADPEIQVLIDRAETFASQALVRAREVREAFDKQTLDLDGARAEVVAAKGALRKVQALDKQITQRTAKAQETKPLQTADKVQDTEVKNPTPEEAAASEALEAASMAMAHARRAALDAEEARRDAALLEMQDKIEKEQGYPQISGVFAIEALRHAENAKIAAKKAQHAATEAHAAADEVTQAIDESVAQIVLTKTKAKAKEAHQFGGEAKAAREMAESLKNRRRKEFDARCKEFSKVRADVDPCGLHASGVSE